MKLNNRWFAKGPQGYCTPGEHMRLSFEEMHRTQFADDGHELLLDSLPRNTLELHLKQIANIQNWQRSNGVTIFPSRDIVEKCIHTEVMEGLQCDDVRVTFPTVLFALPQELALKIDATHHPDRVDGESYSIGHILVSIFERGETFVPHIDGRQRFSLSMPDHSRHLLITAFWSKYFVNSFSIPLGNGTLREILDGTRNTFIGDDLRMSMMDSNDVRQEQQETRMISDWVCPLVINFLLLMQSYPEFVVAMGESHQRPHVYRNAPKPVTYAMSNVRSLLPRQVRIGGDKIDGDGGESRTQMSAHWRRGHWRRQPHTPAWYAGMVSGGNAPKEIDLPDGRRAHMVWIEPVFVGIASKGGDTKKTITD